MSYLDVAVGRKPRGRKGGRGAPVARRRPRACRSYLQVLTQSRKMGKRRSPLRSSPTTSRSRRKNSTHIRRALSASASSASGASDTRLRARVAIRRSWRTSFQHNIALFARPPRHAVAVVGHLRRPRLPHVACLSTPTPAPRSAPCSCSHSAADRRSPRVVEDEDIVVAVLAVPGAAAQTLPRARSKRAVNIIFNYPMRCCRPARGDRPHLEPTWTDLPLYFYLT